MAIQRFSMSAGEKRCGSGVAREQFEGGGLPTLDLLEQINRERLDSNLIFKPLDGLSRREDHITVRRRTETETGGNDDWLSNHGEILELWVPNDELRGLAQKLHLFG